jgi:hypothetical protein
MKPYVATTGILFVIVTAMHVLRIFEEPHLARAPWYVLLTVVTGALSVWAMRLYQKAPRA